MITQHPLRRFRQPAFLLALVVLYGTGGYLLIERWDLLDAFYMTVVTISTVGFAEVHPLGVAGRLFTTTLIVGGVATMLYAFGVFADVVGQGHFAAYRRNRLMERKVSALRDHFIVCGYGRIGTQIVQEFESHRVAYIVVDNNPDAVRRLEREGHLHIEGDAAAEEILRSAGIERARGLICAVDSDERAVYITLAARALNAGLYLLARAGQPASVRRLELAGADRVLSPYRMAGHRLAEMAVRPAVVDVFDALHHGEAEVGVEEILVRAGFGIVGRTLEQAGLTGEKTAQLLAVRRRDGSLHVKPGARLKLEDGDLIVALGSAEQLSETARLVQ